MTKPLTQTTGRRKEAVARVRLRPGTGAILVNRRPFEDYFPVATHRMLSSEALRVTSTEEVYDVDATLDGGGISGQAGALRWASRGAVRARSRDAGHAQAAGLLTRDPGRRRARRPASRRPARRRSTRSGRDRPKSPEAIDVALRFGTDGVRGLANAELTPELALVLGRAAARVLAADRAVIGRDPRRSGPMLEGALAAGFAPAGCMVDLVGVVPTPAVAHLSEADGRHRCRHLRAAQPLRRQRHQALPPGGRKLPDDVEEAIEAELERELAGDIGARPSGTGVGMIRPDPEGVRAYVDHLVSLLLTQGP